MKELVILVADKDMEYTIRGLLKRPHALGIRAITYDLFVHPRHDPGCLNEAHHFLRPLTRGYQHALVLFDHEGCGRDNVMPHVVADDVKQQLEQNGWTGRAEVVVIAPELEVWVWSNSVHVSSCLGWAERNPPLRTWLTDKGYWPADQNKPPRPKEAMLAALREVRKPFSSSIYLDLAEKVSLRGHTEPAFVRLTQALQEWFCQ